MALNPVVLALSRSGEPVAHKIAAALGVQVHGREGRVDRADAFFANALDHTRDLFAAGVPVIGVCASGILIRGVAPLLADKRNEPPVLSVSDDGSVVVPLLGGHRGANKLAHEVSGILGGTAAVTTAGDVALGIALDEPPAGWRLANRDDAKGAMASLLAGGGATVTGDAPWLADLPKGDSLRISACTDRLSQDLGPDHLQFAPQQITVGVGCARDCDPRELAVLGSQTLAEANISDAAIHSINTIGLKADEPAINALAQVYDVPMRLFSADELEAETPRLANPSDVVFAEVGTHGVAEAAALAQAGPDAKLLVTKQKTKNATCALAIAPAPLTDLQGQARGRLSVVGIGPGQATWRTPEVSRLVSEADELVGYGLYIDLLGPLAIGKERSDFYQSSLQIRLG